MFHNCCTLNKYAQKKSHLFFSNEKLEALKHAKKDLLRTWETLIIYQKGSILNLRVCVLRSFIPVGVYFASRSSKLDPPPTFSKRRGD